METTITSLRPLRLGEILDQAVRLYRRNFVTFIGIVALIYVPVTLIQLGLSYFTTSTINMSASDPSQLFGAAYFLAMGGSVVMGYVQLVLVQGVAAAALTIAVTANFLGEQVGIVEAYRRLRESLGRLILTLTILFLLIVALTIAAIFIPCVGWLVGPGMLIFLTLAVNPLLAPNIVMEKQGALESLRRAWDLGRRRFWWLLGFIFILVLFSLLVVFGPTMVLNFILTAIFGSELSINPTLLSTLVAGFVSLTFRLLYLPLQLTAQALVYYDLRVRTEGFDLALLSLQNTGMQPTIEAIQALPLQAPSTRFMEWSDVGNFVILTLAIVGLYILLFALLFFLILGAAGLSRF